MTKPFRFFLVLSCAAVLSACASGTTWQKNSADAQERNSDLSKCRAEANTTVEERYGRDLSADAYPDTAAGTFHQTMTRHSAEKDFNGLVADCMQRKGYSR
jgi:hypothetical protein